MCICVHEWVYICVPKRPNVHVCLYKVISVARTQEKAQFESHWEPWRSRLPRTREGLLFLSGLFCSKSSEPHLDSTVGVSRGERPDRVIQGPKPHQPLIDLFVSLRKSQVPGKDRLPGRSS